MFPPAFIVFLAIVFLAFIVGLLIYKQQIKIRPLVILMGLTIVSEITSVFFAKYYRNNSPVYHCFNPLQIVLLGCFFYKVFEKKILKDFVLYTTIGMILFAIISTIFIEGIMEFPTVFLNVETLVLILWSALLFIQKLDAPSDENVFKNPVFVISIGVLWFNLFSFVFFLLYSYMLTNKISIKTISLLHFFSNYIYYGLILVAFIMYRSSSRYERCN